jgi:hypothetical protein
MLASVLGGVPVIVIFFVIVSIVKALAKAAKGGDDTASSSSGGDENDEQPRVREIQERIRRIAAERRGHLPARPVVVTRPAAPVFQPPAIPPVDTFGGPLQRKLREIERRLQPKLEPLPPVVTESVTARAERAQQARDELEDLDEKKFLATRRTQHVEAARVAETQSETGLRTTARQQLLSDLSDPQSVRRAFVLREVLGPPVGLR